MEKQNRYPGIRPFTQDDDRLFFGRSESIKRINRMFKLERLMVLFGKSGLGKTSLVQAGAIPMLHKEDMKDGVEDFRFETVRFGAYDPEKEVQKSIGLRPVAKLRKAIEMEKGEEATFPTSMLFKSVKDDGSPWLAAKDKQLGGDGRTIVLVIDQSEELFTWPQEDIDAVKYALQDLLNQNIPDQLYENLRQAARSGAIDFGQLMSPPELKAMLIIRSDRLDELDQLADVLPDIYNKRYELPPLDRPSAREAIEEPAALEGEFSTPVFEYSKDGLTYILDFLVNKDQSEEEDGHKKKEQAEGFQLQLICQHVEKIVQRRAKAGEERIVMDVKDIGDLQEVTKTYYQGVLNGIEDVEERDKVQILVEEKLIYDAGPSSRRLNEFDGVIMTSYQISKESLDYLHDSRLLRRMSLSDGNGFMYEISHDSLMAPILEVKKARVALLEKQLEQKSREERFLKQEKEKKEREKERKQKQDARNFVIALILAVLAATGMGLAYRQSIISDTQRLKAVAAEELANSLRKKSEALADSLALKSEELSQRNILLVKANEEATEQTQKAIFQSILAIEARAEAQREKARADSLNLTVFGNALRDKHPWMKRLQSFDIRGYASSLLEDWTDRGALVGDSLLLSDTANFFISQVGNIYNASKSNPEASLHLTNILLNSTHNELSEALGKTILSNGAYRITDDGSKKRANLPYEPSCAVRFNRNGEPRYAIGYANGMLEILDQNLEVVVDNRHFNTHAYPISSIVVSADGHFLLTGSYDGYVHCYDIFENYEEQSEIYYGTDYVRDLAVSEDSKTLYVAGDLYDVKIYELSRVPFKNGQGSQSQFQTSGFREADSIYKWTEISSLTDFEGYVRSIDFSDDEKVMMTVGNYGEMTVWKRNDNSWSRIFKKSIGDGSNLIHIKVEESNVFIKDEYGLCWQMEAIPPYKEEVVSELQVGEGQSFVRQIGFGNINASFMICIDNRGGILLYDHADQKLVGLMKDSLDVKLLVNDQLGNSILTYSGDTLKVHSYEIIPLNYSFNDLLDGNNLPRLENNVALQFGILDLEELENISAEEKASLFLRGLSMILGRGQKKSMIL